MRLIDADEMRQDWLENGQNEYVYDTNAVLDSIDEQPTIDPEFLRPKGRWVVNRKSFDGYEHHRCSHCGTDAPFAYTYRDDWDEGMDGEWYYLGQIDDGIEEQMGFYCPNCGADLRGESDARD